MIAKFIDGTFYTMDGEELNPFLESNGYKKYDFKLELDKDGKVYKYYLENGKPDLDKIALEVLEQNNQELKQAKIIALDKIKVTTSNNNTYDGNKTARVNLLAEIMSYEVLGEEEVTWHLADNSDVKVTITELKEALALSVREAGRIVKAKTMEEL